MVTEGKRRKILARYGGRCAYCGIPLTEETMTIDHFIPKEQLKKNSKFKGGDNLVPSCKPCNLIKRAYNIKITRMIFRKMVNGFLKRAGHEELRSREFKFLFEDEAYLEKLPRARKEAVKRNDENHKKTERNAKIKKSLEDCTNNELLNEICKLKNTVQSLKSKNVRKKRKAAAKSRQSEQRKPNQKQNGKNQQQKQKSKNKTVAK